MAAAAAAAAPKGPVAEIAPERLVFDCKLGDSAAGTVTLRATGDAAVYFSWSPSRPQDPLPGGRAQHVRAFYLAAHAGSVLPGEEVQFKFLFKPDCAGVFTEHWHLHVSPSGTQVSGNTVVTLRGSAVVHDTCALGRSLLQAEMEQAQKARQVEAALERILTDVDAPVPRDAPMSVEQWRAHDRFAAGTVNRTPPVYYHAGIEAQLQKLFDELREVLVPPADPKQKLKKGEVPPPPAMPEEFDGRVDSLLAFVDKVSPLVHGPCAPLLFATHLLSPRCLNSNFFLCSCDRCAFAAEGAACSGASTCRRLCCGHYQHLGAGCHSATAARCACSCAAQHCAGSSRRH